MKLKIYISLGIFLNIFANSIEAEDIDVTKIQVIELNSQTALETRVFHSKHSGRHDYVGYSTNGVIEGGDVKCTNGERFWAESKSGYTRINWPTDKCAKEVTVYLAAPTLAYALSLSELASSFEARGNYSVAAVLNSDAQARIDFQARSQEGQSIKADVAKKAYRNLEKALNQATSQIGTTKLYDLTEKGWPVLTQAGEQAISQLQEKAGTEVTGKFDLNTYKALGVNELNSFQLQALGEIDGQNMQ
jgi:hypothetical protein